MLKKLAGLLIFEGQYKFKSLGKVHVVEFLIACESMVDAAFLAGQRWPKEKMKFERIGMLGRAQLPGIFFVQTK